MKLEMITHQPDEPGDLPPLLCVHGIVHGAWCYEDYFLPYFAEAGYRASAISLRHHAGSDPGPKSLGRTSLVDYVEDLSSAAAEIEARSGQRPVLIGHSMGGLVVQRLLAQQDFPAAVLLASVPPYGIVPSFLRVMRENPRALRLAALPRDPGVLLRYPDLTRYACFSEDLADELVLRHIERMQPESLRVMFDMALTFRQQARPVATPLLVLGAEDDRMISVADVEATAQAYGVRAQIFPHMAHDMMLEPTWRDCADAILAWLPTQVYANQN